MMTKTLLFVGCGAGLGDPSVGPALRFAADITRADSLSKTEHFLLVIGKDLKAARLVWQHHSGIVTPVAYGATHAELPRFLETLAKRQMPNASQEPAYYEEPPPRQPLVRLLDLAGPADEHLGDALDATRRALRAMGQLERRTASPAGLHGWSPADQLAVLEQLAAASAKPAEWLTTSVAQLAVAVQDAGDLASQLLAQHFASGWERLKPLVHNVRELDSLVADLERRLSAVVDDLSERAKIVGAYRGSVSALQESAQLVEEALQSTAELRDGFGTSPDHV